MIGRKGAGQLAITGPAARAQVHALRAEMDAILVGIGTARADDPELTCRAQGLEARSPLRIVLDRQFDLPVTSRLVKTAREVPVLIASLPDPLAHPSGGETRDIERRQALTAEGVEILEPESLPMLLAALAARGISSLLVEGGAHIARSFLEAGLVDRILLFTGAGTVGEGAIESPLRHADIGTEHATAAAPAGFRLLRSDAFGPDRLTEYERSS
jgi:diaminohydroxyphosphoribosylaminopyrimidine deaminase/5-amino-6-(5-phosphoribosylamino)uracil reductase